MIQAPQLQYIPAQQPTQQGYQPQVAQQPVQYAQQAPGYIYNYPQTSCYNQPNAGKSQYNGVNIEIINPQANGIPQGMTQTMPAQYVPVQQPVYIPQYQQPAVPVQYPQAPAVMPAEQGFQQVAQQPAPQIPVDANAQQVAAQPQQVPAQQQAPVAEQAQTAPVVDQPQNIDPSATIESFKAKLNNDNTDTQKEGIEELAVAVKDRTPEAAVLLDTEIMDSLVNIINKDTKALEGPTPEVIELRQKPQEELSEQDKTKAMTPSPLEKAELNKQYALYTIAYMQDFLNEKLKEQGQSVLPLKDLPCIEQVITTVKENENPMLRVSAINALSHIAKPEYKEDLSTIFELAKSDEDANVQQAATQALENINK